MITQMKDGENGPTLKASKQLISDFCEARDWDQFHNPKDLAIGLVTEASELLELFRFLTDKDIEKKLQVPEFKEKLSHELADSFFFLLRLSEKLEISLQDALAEKLKINAQKYPVEKAKGKNQKYTEL